MGFFARALDIAVFLHLSRHALAAAAGLSGKTKSWDWAHEQIREGVRNPEWFREELIDKIGAALSRLFHRIGDCRSPPYLAPKMAPDLREMRGLVSGRRMQAIAGEPLRASRELRSCLTEFGPRTETLAVRTGEGESCGWEADSHRKRGHFEWAL